MTRIQARLIAKLKDRLGPEATLDQVVDELYQLAVLDDVLAKRGVVLMELFDRCATTDRSVRSIMLDLTLEYDIASVSNIQYMAGKVRPRV